MAWSNELARLKDGAFGDHARERERFAATSAETDARLIAAAEGGDTKAARLLLRIAGNCIKVDAPMSLPLREYLARAFFEIGGDGSRAYGYRDPDQRNRARASLPGLDDASFLDLGQWVARIGGPPEDLRGRKDDLDAYLKKCSGHGNANDALHLVRKGHAGRPAQESDEEIMIRLFDTTLLADIEAEMQAGSTSKKRAQSRVAERAGVSVAYLQKLESDQKEALARRSLMREHEDIFRAMIEAGFGADLERIIRGELLRDYATVHDVPLTALKRALDSAVPKLRDFLRTRQ